MESTREQLLSDITTWTETPNAPVVFWLNGLAGTGKSTIARTICQHLEETGLLGASFFFSRQVAERRHAPNVVRTIAYQLARKQAVFAHALSATLQDAPDLASAQGLQKLTTGLLFNPAAVIAADARLILVLDALDECSEDSSGRPGAELLPLLLRGLLQLSGRIKLLLTSRAEPEIVRMFSAASLGCQKTVMQLHDLDAAVVRSDIRAYFNASFAKIAAARPELGLLNWPLEKDIDVLVDLTNVLFVFAATVVRFVGTPKYSPRSRLDILLARRESKSEMPYHWLDQLYIQVLQTSVRSDQKEFAEELCERLRNVVGIIIAAQQPLSISVHSILVNVDQAEAQLMVESLSSLLLSTSHSEPVRIFHPSFPNFIVDPRRCDNPHFRVSLDDHHLRLALGCLMLLNKHLRYNMANLDDPDLANSYVENLEDRLLSSLCEQDNHAVTSLPQALFYAARYWTTHVVSMSTDYSEELLDALSRFCAEHLLHWLELLSLIQGLAYSTQSDLLAVISWSHVNQRFAGDARVAKIGDLLRDAVHILQAYAETIRSHALHTYHSAYVTLPHCRLSDTLTQANMTRVRHTLVSPRAAHWGSSGPVLQAGSTVRGVTFVPNRPLVIAGMLSASLRVWSTDNFEEVAALSGHKDEIMSFATSSDGSRIASGSRDRTMRAWDGRTFEALGLCEHEDEVNSVAFSPDGSLIASGSDDRTVWIWNVLTLEKVTRLTGHEDIVTAVVFFPDGTRIASASFDCTARMWDSRNYEPLPGIQCSGPVYAIAISSDSTRLALSEHTSGSNGILRVFDTVTLAEQAQVNISPGPFTPWSIAFSPSGDRIASGTASGAIRVWDASSLSNLWTISGHHGRVTSIAFSSHGSQVVSGSADGTVRIRPVASSEEQIAPIPGHDARVNQVVFSSDGSRVVSGSEDSTVRIWDGLTCEELAVLHGHEDIVRTVAYSPDGARVTSGSHDHTVRVWDALDFREIAVLRGHCNWVTFVTFAPDGALIASCSWDHTVRLWSSSTLPESARLEGHTAVVWSVAFSPNGTRLVSTSADKTVRVWDAVSFTQLAELEPHHTRNHLLFATFSLDGKAILTRLWDDGPSWVCNDEDESEHLFNVGQGRWADYGFVATWTAVPYDTAISAHPQHPQPRSYNDGWFECTTGSGPSRIWLPAERQTLAINAAAATESRLVIGGSNGAMTMIALS
jgi:WD40 repeat protein